MGVERDLVLTLPEEQLPLGPVLHPLLCPSGLRLLSHKPVPATVRVNTCLTQTAHSHVICKLWVGPHHVRGDEVPQGHHGDEGGQEAPGEEDNPVAGQHA